MSFMSIMKLIVCTFISAQLYQNEKEVGQAVLSQDSWKREDIWVTTKVDSLIERKMILD